MFTVVRKQVHAVGALMPKAFTENINDICATVNPLFLLMVVPSSRDSVNINALVHDMSNIT